MSEEHLFSHAIFTYPPFFKDQFHYWDCNKDSGIKGFYPELQSDDKSKLKCAEHSYAIDNDGK
jgi:hypothetical protein